LGLRSTWETWEPGAHYYYSAWLAQSLIAIICERLTGQRFDEFAHNVLFGPLDIDAAYLAGNLRDTQNIAVHYDYQHRIFYTAEDIILADYDTRVSDHDRAGAHLLTSSLGYSKILAMLGNEGFVDETRILSERAIQEIHNANVEGDYYMQGLSTRYERDLNRPFPGHYWHTGGAFGTGAQYIHFFDENTNRGVVVITTGGSHDRNRVTLLDLTAIAWQVLIQGSPGD
jgi:CubicO group peptidase (beta-lactamase class C family)